MDSSGPCGGKLVLVLPPQSSRIAEARTKYARRCNWARYRSSSPEIIMLVIVGIRRDRRGWHGMILELWQQDRTRALQLQVMTSCHILRQFFYLDVRRDAVAFHFPFAIQTV